jgi:biopolymer transport protein ExbB
MDEIRLVAAICRNYIKESGRVRLYEGKFFSESGGVVTGRIGRIGALGGVYQSEDKTGYLTVDEAGRALSAVTGRIPNAALKKVRIFMAGQAQSLPLDISGGSVFLQFTQKKSVRQWLKSGGLLVWPILGIGVLALLLSVERVFFFLRIRANSDTILKKITAFVQEGNLAACKEYCTTKMNFPTCRILSNCLTHLGQPQEVLDSALEEALLNQMPRLEKFLPTLSMLAAISPLLGLLGTVTGMISTFQVINIFGTGDPKMMSGGISEALITTQIGLAVAIPIMFLHHIFERRVDNLVADLEEKGTAFKITLLKKESM